MHHALDAFQQQAAHHTYFLHIFVASLDLNLCTCGLGTLDESIIKKSIHPYHIIKISVVRAKPLQAHAERIALFDSEHILYKYLTIKHI